MDEMQQMQAMGQVPEQGQQQSGEPQPPVEGDLETLSKNTLGEMEKEIAELETSLDVNYAKEFVKGMSQEEHDMMLNEPEKFLRAYEQRKAADLEQKLKPRREKIKVFKENLAKIEGSKARAQIEQEFNAKHKDMPAAKVIEFLHEDLPKRTQKELDAKWQKNNTSTMEQLEEVYAMMKKGKNQDALPFDVSGEKHGTIESGNQPISSFLRN